MASLKPTTDPYRTLGILRGADPEQIKAAHRHLAKRYHPDGSKGDEPRFLAVQEAYQLLSDPLRRSDWDRAHAPGPVRAATGRRRQDGAASATAQGVRRRGQTTRTAEAARTARTARGARTPPAPGEAARTWTAGRVPWWEDFRADATSAPETPDSQPHEPVHESDVYSRSSGAAWSSAARRHFRRGTDDLPSRGAWRYRGTQVVTGAEARKVAAEEEEENRPR